MMKIKPDDFVNALLSYQNTHSYNTIYNYIDSVIDQILGKKRISICYDTKADLKDRIHVHIWQKIEKVKASKYPKTYLGTLISNQVVNFLRDEARRTQRERKLHIEYYKEYYC